MIEEPFVGREAELKSINTAFELLQEKHPLPNPIVNYYGVGGIGKTLLLRNIQQCCQDRHLHCIWVDASQGIANCVRAILQQVRLSGVPLPFEESEESRYQVAPALRILLGRWSAVLLFDTVDVNNEEQVGWLETLLGELAGCNNICIVFASTRVISFENDLSLARKLTSVPLPPLDRLATEAYLGWIGDQSEPEIRQMFFAWTHGYPLALKAMVQAVASGLDPRKAEDQKALIAMIAEQVRRQNILVKGDAALSSWRAIVSLLSISRHCTIEIMQDLIEAFLPEQKRKNSLTYFDLAREINQTVDVLRWNPIGNDFFVEAPIRAIFSLELKIEQPERYYAIHRFLAQMYRRWAGDEVRTDPMRYLRNYLYHMVCAVETQELEQVLPFWVKDIIAEFPLLALQLSDEIARDTDFNELLGQRIKSLLS